MRVQPILGLFIVKVFNLNEWVDVLKLAGSATPRSDSACIEYAAAPLSPVEGLEARPGQSGAWARPASGGGWREGAPSPSAG
jgi:hypothetical protein